MNHFPILIGQPQRGGAARPLPARDRIQRHIDANFYPTPPEAVRALLSVESFDGTIQEPACGQGHISRVLEATGHQVVSTDLNDWGLWGSRSGLPAAGPATGEAHRHQPALWAGPRG